MIQPLSPHDLWAQARRETYLIVGLGPRTGHAAARLFDRQGVRYRISERQPRSAIAPLLADLKVAPDDVLCGPQDPSQLDGVTSVLLSPGVPRTLPLVMEAERRGLPVLGDLDFLYPFLAHKKIAAITGTDGKTTTTTLAGELLATLGKVVVAGNIGVSVLARYDDILACDWLVLEVSSFMLEKIRAFRANVSVVLNVAQDHVDRYSSIADYAAVKLGIMKHARAGDVLIKNIDDPWIAPFEPLRGRVRSFSPSAAPADDRFVDGVFQVGRARFPYEGSRLRGLQNIPNILAAAAIADEAGVPPSRIASVIRSFEGLRHRLQFVGRFRGVDVYDDSKASNVHAVDAALANFPSNVVLILGGRDKGLDFTVLRRHAHRIKCVVCYGESGQAIRASLGFEPSLYAWPFEQAVRLAADQCAAGDTLLMSPGCTSWDQFDSYEVRGDLFQSLVPTILARHSHHA